MNFLKSLKWSSNPPKPTDPSVSPVTDDIAKLKLESADNADDHAIEKRTEEEGRRFGLFSKILSSKLGMDISVGVSLPVWLFEPMTIIQKMAEMLQFADLLNEAAGFENPLDRMAWVAVFAVTGYHCSERFTKPFNPVLGETFEYVDEATHVKFFAEQVSHHPPISACHAENENFVFWQETRLKTKFNGNSVDIDTNSKTHIYFPKSRDHFVYTNPLTRVNNLILGRLWIDHFGAMPITNLRTGDTCTLNYEQCGWLSKRRFEVAGIVKDSTGKDCLTVSGKWSEDMTVSWLYGQGKHVKDTCITVWRRPQIIPIGKYKFSDYTMKLNEINPKYKAIVPSTDSRLRPDRLALERSEMSEAAILKSRLEDKQRLDKQGRAVKEEDWTPTWFKEIPDENGEGNIWVYCGDYWDQRQKKMDLLNGEMTEETKIQLNSLLNNPKIANMVCDFRGN